MYLVQIVRGICRWSGTDIHGKRSFDSLQVSHAPVPTSGFPPTLFWISDLRDSPIKRLRRSLESALLTYNA